MNPWIFPFVAFVIAQLAILGQLWLLHTRMRNVERETHTHHAVIHPESPMGKMHEALTAFETAMLRAFTGEATGA